MYYTHFESPVGALLLAGDGSALTHILFPENGHAVKPHAEWIERGSAFEAVARELEEYFAGTRRTFSVELAPSGTPFQLQVLDALRQIPYGETRSYSEIARAIGRPSAQRAVGAANGRNPIPIIIPCHRVIGQRGDLVGFGGGIAVKRFLLDLEGAGVPQRSLAL